jgi:hypothetical protein
MKKNIGNNKNNIRSLGFNPPTLYPLQTPSPTHTATTFETPGLFPSFSPSQSIAPSQPSLVNITNSPTSSAPKAPNNNTLEIIVGSIGLLVLLIATALGVKKCGTIRTQEDQRRNRQRLTGAINQRTAFGSRVPYHNLLENPWDLESNNSATPHTSLFTRLSNLFNRTGDRRRPPTTAEMTRRWNEALEFLPEIERQREEGDKQKRLVEEKKNSEQSVTEVSHPLNLNQTLPIIRDIANSTESTNDNSSMSEVVTTIQPIVTELNNNLIIIAIPSAQSNRDSNASTFDGDIIENDDPNYSDSQEVSSMGSMFISVASENPLSPSPNISPVRRGEYSILENSSDSAQHTL